MTQTDMEARSRMLEDELRATREARQARAPSRMRLVALHVKPRPSPPAPSKPRKPRARIGTIGRVKWAYAIPDARSRPHEARKWSLAVRARDGCCRDCGATVGLQAHHLKPWASFPELRYDVGNGVTLCGGCHARRHPENAALRRWASC